MEPILHKSYHGNQRSLRANRLSYFPHLPRWAENCER